MRVSLIIVFLAGFFVNTAQTSFTVPASSMLHKLAAGDSLVYYQCHVEQGVQQLSTASGQTLTTASQDYSITEKYIIKRDSLGYRISYYVSSLTVMPNRKFSGLKIRERAYWNFKLLRESVLDEKAIKYLVALEQKGREGTEYDFAITRYTTNQLIIKKRKDFKQLVIEGNYILSRLLFEKA